MFLLHFKDAVDTQYYTSLLTTSSDTPQIKNKKILIATAQDHFKNYKSWGHVNPSVFVSSNHIKIQITFL